MTKDNAFMVHVVLCTGSVIALGALIHSLPAGCLAGAAVSNFMFGVRIAFATGGE
jgi:hypothetical protein